ncbi:MAG: ABC transporter ATP-binding protein [Gaiellales bacterium]|nr:ABC transporter ATP-binding protein [Gaiellales bacterium]
MLEARALTLHFAGIAALDDFNLTVPDRRVVSVLGPSGCGKSTLLRAIAGLQRVEQGQILWDGDPLDHLPPHRRGFGLMFQDYSLFPHKSVAGNVAFGLRMAGVQGAELSRRVGAALERVGLHGYGNRAIGNLSGGEQQRVALARALAPEPRLLMLDEPLGALDRTLRERLTEELRELFATLGITAIYVTHDQEEAFALADRVVVMRRGQVAQEGSPEEVWWKPADEWVARFLGLANIVEARVANGWAETAWGRLPLGDQRKGAHLPAAGGAAGSADMRIVVRPTAFVPAADGPIQGQVVSRVFLGGVYRLVVKTPSGARLQVELADGGSPRLGEPLSLRVDPKGIVILGG